MNILPGGGDNAGQHFCTERKNTKKIKNTNF